MLLKLDGTLWVQLFNFVIFFAILNVVFLRPVAAALKKRRDYINSVTAHYDEYRGQAAELQARAEATRATARREAELTLSKARADISNQTAQMSADFGKQAMQQVEQAHQTVAAELLAARATEPQTVAQLADMMLDRTLSEAAR
ncbi:MAG: hypothetical protein NVSMB31_08700 [Vulcanimicrobiaceae bacterium]